jgi:hypothetical protein
MKMFLSQQSPADQIPTSDLEHVLVIQLDDAGAVVMLSAALRTLRGRFPRPN